MSGLAYALRMLLVSAAAVILMFAASVPVAALHPHWDNDACDAVQAVFGMMFCGGCVTGLIVLSMLPTAISVLIAVWIYYDARKRNDPNAVPWALLGFLLNVVGWIAYLIARGRLPLLLPLRPFRRGRCRRITRRRAPENGSQAR